MARAIFLQALSDYTRLRRLFPWLLVAGFCAVLAWSWQFMNAASAPIDRYSAVSQMLVFRVVALAAAIFATANISAEVEQRTIVYLLTRPVPRWMLLLMRYLAAVLVVSGVCIVAAVGVSVAAFGNPFSNPLLIKDILVLILGAFAYNGLFVLISLVSNRAMIICLLYAFGWEIAVPNMPGTMYYLSIYSHLQAVAQHATNPELGKMVSFLAAMLGTNTLSEGTSLPVLVLISVTTVALAVFWFTHFEFVPRDDAE